MSTTITLPPSPRSTRSNSVPPTRTEGLFPAISRELKILFCGLMAIAAASVAAYAWTADQF